MELEQQAPRVLIRKYCYGDEKAIIQLVREGTMMTVNPFFLSAATKECIAQVILMLAAILFIVVGYSLQYSLLAIPITLVTLYVGLYIGHWVKAAKTHTDLYDIQARYLERAKCGFWVAILLDSKSSSNQTSSTSSSSKSSITQYEFVKEDEDGCKSNEIDQTLFPAQQNLIGALAIDIKEDPDMKEPPDSVAILKRLAVSKRHQRKGIATAIIDVALDHCLKYKFRAVELTTTEHHEAARNLYTKKGFELINSYHKSFFMGLVSLTLYRLRLPCSILINNKAKNGIDDDSVEDGSSAIYCHENVDPVT